jgi:AraC-like DNA-binding protein
MASRATAKISVSATTGLLEAIVEAGGSPDEILRTFGLERSAFSDSEGFIEAALYGRLLEEVARQTTDDCFGLHFGERYNPKNIGPLAYVILNSPTIRAGIENAERYLQVHNQSARWFFTVEDNRARICHELKNLEITAPRQYHELCMAVALNTLRLMVGSQWSPLEVQFAHAAPANISEHLRIFRSPVLFGYGVNAFVIEREFAERQVPAADPRLYGILKQYLERVLEEMPQEDGFLATVRRTIAEVMRDGDPTLARVAKKLAMSPRTVERRLNERGMIFKKLLEDTRRHFAITYLKDRQNSLTEVAFLLGYSELSAFNRAFKRWTGHTPMDYRRNGK